MPASIKLPLIDWSAELPMIQKESLRRGLDPQFIRTIRHIEHGRAGREFGVLADGNDTYAEQLASCAATVVHRLETYPANPLQRCYSPNHSRVRYTPSFISYFASVYCPIGADNDPTNLNKNWLKNALKAYDKFVAEEMSTDANAT